ncbi:MULTISPECIES: serine/threonine protein kinase [Moorena]|uniref:non-specific serine/threonine protein kinase n=3 Tax=Moorena TaxID=1155738 RepID=F4Y031_9CYAN|nr:MULTISPECIES: serine/threonine protein kinase [Moorena]NEQ14340.1 protein kinase [Moorena sp. SIO3E2]EGJ29763.1 serine/threonine protein kinase [Moorena producens 3L]NEP34613.1 protein kinase [Moorena sp. SIO3B2]NEP65690.1 protein kinase [Moorena sp. SIO3A5]NER85928.1 protein kinase [Moorena sp. SIO3A2]
MNPKLLNNRYRVLETLGSGGFGDTFLAEDIHMPSRRRCVIKQLKALAHNPKAYKLVQERFQREAAVLEALGEGHDQIPRLYAYFSEAEKFYLVQEWIRGNTFTTQVRQGKKFTEIEVRELLISLLRVLEYVHSRRIIHRDIKPDNIIIRQRDGVPVLIDFGAVKEAMSTVVTNSGTPHPASIIIGTPGYMSSEQSAGHPTYSSDLYSLGLTAILLLTGKIPQLFHTDERTGEILWRQDAPPLYSNLGIVLDKAIRFHPRDRFISARQMLDALQSDPASPTEATVPISPGAPSTANKGTVATVPISPGDSPPANKGSVSTIKGPLPVTVKQNDSYKAVLKGGLIGGGILLIVVAFGSGFNKFLNPSTTVPSYDQSKSTSYPDKPSSQESQDKKVSSKDPSPETISSSSQSQTKDKSPVTKPETPSYPSQSQTNNPSPVTTPETTVTDPVTPSNPSQPETTVTDPVTPSNPSQPETTVTDPVTPSSPSQPETAVTDPVTPSNPSQPDTKVTDPVTTPSISKPETKVTDPVTPTSPSKPDTTVKPVPVTTRKPITEPSPIVENNTNNQNLAQLKAIPKFPPGTQRRAVEYALGKPTKKSNGMWKTRAFLYKNVVPNQVDLGYLFDRSSGRLRQTEVTFSQSVDLEIMSQTLDKLLSNNISTDIKQGLKDVYQRESKTYKFSSGNNNRLQGVIERDGSDRIYIGVWEADLK